MVRSSPMYASQGIAPWKSTHDELGLGGNSACFCEYLRQKTHTSSGYRGKENIQRHHALWICFK